jgi:hypothetical protein
LGAPRQVASAAATMSAGAFGLSTGEAPALTGASAGIAAGAITIGVQGAEPAQGAAATAAAGSLGASTNLENPTLVGAYLQTGAGTLIRTHGFSIATQSYGAFPQGQILAQALSSTVMTAVAATFGAVAAPLLVGVGLIGAAAAPGASGSETHALGGAGVTTAVGALGASASTGGPLDNLSFTGSPTAGFSLRRLKAAYSGPAVNVRNGSTGAFQDIGFNAAGDDLDTVALAAFLGSATGYVARWYNQLFPGVDLIQPTAANQFYIVVGGSPGGKCVLRGAALGFGSSTATTGMYAADDPSFKTAIVHGFILCSQNNFINAGNYTPRRWIIGYPLTANTDAGFASFPTPQHPWLLASIFDCSYLNLHVMSQDGNNDFDGFGAAYSKYLFQYDFNTSQRTIYYNNTEFFDGADGSNISYANPVGLYVGMDSAGGSNLNGDWAEILLFSATQTSAQRQALSTNQSNWAGVVNPPATMTAYDGKVFTMDYTGAGDGSYGGPLGGSTQYQDSTGNKYATQGCWEGYSFGHYVDSVSGKNVYRFEVREGDCDNITGAERMECDGSYGVTWPAGTTVQGSYAFLEEPGTGYTLNNGDWNTRGQWHYVNAAYPPASVALNLNNDHISIDTDGASNNVNVYLAPSPITRGAWNDVFFEQNVSASGTADNLKVWINGTQVVNLSGSLFPHGKQAIYFKFGIYSGAPEAHPQTRKVRYANIEVTNKLVNDLTSRIANPLPHPV